LLPLHSAIVGMRGRIVVIGLCRLMAAFIGRPLTPPIDLPGASDSPFQPHP